MMTNYLNRSETSKPLVDAVSRRFAEIWGIPPTIAAVAPGRVNVIGEHVDYNGGWVLPAAIERHMVLAVRPREDGRIRLAAAANGERAIEFRMDELAADGGRNWERYVKGVLAGLARQGITVPGFDAYLDSTIPVGGGLSSSAALEAVSGLAALALCGGEMDRFALAKLCQQAEHEYAGVPCGIMDQAAVLICQKDHLLLLDCEEETTTQVRFDAPDWELMIINSRVAHELASGEYGQRRAACHAAAEILGVSSLRHVALETLSDTLARPGLSEEMRRCVRHVVTENNRTHRTVSALGRGDVITAGRLLNASHDSLRDDYQVSCEELDFIAATAQKLPGVAGCRMTGGGFGGSAIALVRVDDAERVTSTLSQAYAEAFGRQPGIFLTSPEAGAEAFMLDGTPKHS